MIKDFQNVRNINSVFLFSDWFASKRKAVVYGQWLKETFPTIRFKKITKPSETRWTFYRDVLNSILSQVDQVDQFLMQDEDFVEFRPKLSIVGSVSDMGSSRELFANQFILSHFKFAQFILEKLCLMNEQLQEQYSFLPLCWSSIQQMKGVFEAYERKMKNGIFDDFVYVGGFHSREKETFILVIQRLILNIQIRFPCPSTSIGARKAKRNTDFTTNTVDQGFLRSVKLRCDLFETVGIFLFPGVFLNERTINPSSSLVTIQRLKE